MTLLLHDEVLVPIIQFCMFLFLQTHNLNYGLITGKLKSLLSLLEKIGESLIMKV